MACLARLIKPIISFWNACSTSESLRRLPTYRSLPRFCHLLYGLSFRRFLLTLSRVYKLFTESVCPCLSPSGLGFDPRWRSIILWVKSCSPVTIYFNTIINTPRRIVHLTVTSHVSLIMLLSSCLCKDHAKSEKCDTPQKGYIFLLS